jgi:hypothetical protein
MRRRHVYENYDTLEELAMDRATPVSMLPADPIERVRHIIALFDNGMLSKDGVIELLRRGELFAGN